MGVAGGVWDGLLALFGTLVGGGLVGFTQKRHDERAVVAEKNREDRRYKREADIEQIAAIGELVRAVTAVFGAARKGAMNVTHADIVARAERIDEITSDLRAREDEVLGISAMVKDADIANEAIDILHRLGTYLVESANAEVNERPPQGEDFEDIDRDLDSFTKRARDRMDSYRLPPGDKRQ